jgi:hypothetical protein
MARLTDFHRQHQPARTRAFALNSPEQARSRATEPRVAACHRWSPAHAHTFHGSTPGESLVTIEPYPVPLWPSFAGIAPANLAVEPKGSIACPHLVPGSFLLTRGWSVIVLKVPRGFVHIDSSTPSWICLQLVKSVGIHRKIRKLWNQFCWMRCDEHYLS